MLLVEDNPTDVFVIQEVIEECGLKLRLDIARSGHEALLYLRDLARIEESSRPVLVLLDLNLPKVGGIEVLRKLREDSLCGQTPVIVVTSSTAETDRNAVRSLGAEMYFQKPNSLEGYQQLAEVIKRAVGRSG